MIVANLPSRYRIPAVEDVQRALRDAVTVEDARARVAFFDLSTGKKRPAWYREERLADEHAATLVNGTVLAWGRVFPGEPWELFVWLDADRGTVIWREKL